MKIITKLTLASVRQMPSLSGRAFKIALSVSPFPLNFTRKPSSQNRKHYHTIIQTV